MSNQAETFEASEYELEQYWESRWRDAYDHISMLSEDLRDYLRYQGADYDLVEKAEEAYLKIMRSDASDHLIEAVEEALPDTLQEFVTALREKSNG
jgi:hypothetical protein